MVEPQPPKPKSILDFLIKFNGMEKRLIVTEKELSTRDVNQSQSRLMLPDNKVRSKEEFLREEEITILEKSTNEAARRKEGVPAIFVDPEYETYEVLLKQWTKNLVILLEACS